MHSFREDTAATRVGRPVYAESTPCEGESFNVRPATTGDLPPTASCCGHEETLGHLHVYYMHFWVDGAQNHPQPVEHFGRSFEPPVQAENDVISPWTDGFDHLLLAAGRLGSAEIRGPFARGQALGKDDTCVHGQERHDHRTGIWCRVLTMQALPTASSPRSACSCRNGAKALEDSHLLLTMKTMMRRPGYATEIPWVGSEKISVMSS